MAATKRVSLSEKLRGGLRITHEMANAQLNEAAGVLSCALNGVTVATPT